MTNSLCETLKRRHSVRLEEKNRLGDLDVDARIIFNCVLNRVEGRVLDLHDT